MKSSSFDLEELNCWNKNLDVGLDALEHNLDSFFHETCLLVEFSCHLWKILSPLWHCFWLKFGALIFIWIRNFWLKFGALIFIWIRNPIKLSLHQLNFCSSRYSSCNGRRSTLSYCKIWLWRLWFPCSFLFYFLPLNFQKGIDVSFLMPLESLHFDLQSSRSAQNIDWRSNLPITSNLLIFASFIQKCLQNIKKRISRHFIYKT